MATLRLSSVRAERGLTRHSSGRAKGRFAPLATPLNHNVRALVLLRLFALVLALALAMSNSRAANFSEGEVWSYNTRAGETESTVLINKIENDPRLGVIYHISVLGVSVKSRHAPSGITRELPHIPVGRETLEASCIKLVGHSAPNPAYAEGYAQWRHAFEKGQAGVFNIPVSEIVSIVESAINQ